jgi:hypothetical protein
MMQAPADRAVIVGRFASPTEAARAVDALRHAGIHWTCIERPASHATVALTVPGRSDRCFAIDTLRELGARVELREPVTLA